MTEIETLASNMDFARQFTKFYFKDLKHADIHHRFELNGKLLNSAFWQIAHLTAAENWLLLHGLGGQMEKFSWAKHFLPGSTPPTAADCPPIAEIIECATLVHSKALEHVRSLTAEQINEEHRIGFSVGAAGTKRECLMHAARHEAAHAGQLAILCSLHGISKV